ncbi:Uma2 family endonuclease [Streptomyces sp. NPDC020800]|uniref:Uma2 family endonuclease n=1 Tax=Streptomyces sp. NPDC020800 TaxID=3365092 RepID=UPI0037BC08F9
MTVLEDRIAMAESDNPITLDELFERLERMPVPEGYKVEIVEGTVFMSPQRDTHWKIIRRIVRALEDKFGMDVNVLSDVRIDFPGILNGYAPDVAKICDGAEKNAKGLWRHQDLEFVAEVISQGTAANDYGPKKTAYATAEVPVYVIADPYQRRCHLYTQPKEGDYEIETTVPFGSGLDLTNTVVGLTLKTDDFPRD